jgi:hypothetical protein
VHPHDLHGFAVFQQIDQRGDALYQPHIIALIGVLQIALQLFDGGATKL